MKVWQYGAFCSLISWGLSTQLCAQDGYTVPIGNQSGLKIKAPERGAFHSAFVDTNDNLTSGADLLDRVRSYEEQTGLRLQLVSMQSNWRNGFEFPLQAVQDLYDAGYFALVRIMPGLDSRIDTGKPDPIFDLRKLAEGSFDGPLVKMFQALAALKGKNGQTIPVMIAFAPEPNGGRYRHSGAIYGAGQSTGWGDPSIPDGPEIYRDAYRHLIELARRADVKATNITWALHLDSEARPAESWNAMKLYYPGDDYIDWLGLTVLGAQSQENIPGYQQFQDVLYGPSLQEENRWSEFLRVSERAYKGLFKFAVIEDPGQSCRKADWVSRALQAIPSQFSQFKLVSYWSESVAQNPAKSFRLDTSKCAVDAYKAEIRAGFFQGKLRVDRPDEPTIPSTPSIEDVPQYAVAYNCQQDVRSFPGSLRLMATFQGSLEYEVHWIDAQGRWTYMGQARPGRPLKITTTAGHAFAIKFKGQCAGKVKIGLNNNIFQVGS